MVYSHGIYVSEQETSLTAPVHGTAGLQVVFGTAPCNLADDPAAAVNQPKICYSFAEAKAAVGYCDDFKNYTLCQAIDASFRVFNTAPIILVNVLDPAKHKTAVEKAEMTLTKNQVTISADGKPVFGVIKSSLKVSAGATGADLEEGKDYLVSYDDSGFCTVTSLTNAANLYIGYDKLDPAAVKADDIIGSVGADGKETGLELLRTIYPKFGMTAGLISAPGWSHNATVCAALEAKCTGINGVFSCECVVDIPTAAAKVYSAVKDEKEKLGADSAHAIACWPMGKVGEKVYYLSALISALQSYTDANNDDVPYHSPSNQSLGITGLCLEDGTEVVLDQDQANTINSYGVVTALNMNGFKAWGNNTAVYSSTGPTGNKTATYPSSTDPKDRWISCRRMFTWWGNTLIQNYFKKVDTPMNRRLIENVVDSENIRGNSFVARGYVAGASVEFNEADNPSADLLNGIIRFKVNLAPYVPAETINFVLEFDTNALTSAIVGGE